MVKNIMKRLGGMLLLCIMAANFAVGAWADDGASAECSYGITITEPQGWYTESAEMQITVTDENGTGWEKVEVNRGNSSEWDDVTSEMSDGEMSYIVTENGFYTVCVTGTDGETHCVTAEITCFDKTAPSVQAGITDQLLHAVAQDSQSGVYGIYVDDQLYTTLIDNALDIRLSDYTYASEKILVKAVDNMGNISGATELGNPYYSTSTPTPSATETPEPTATASPSQITIYTSSGTDTPASTTTTSTTGTGTTSSSTGTTSSGTTTSTGTTGTGSTSSGTITTTSTVSSTPTTTTESSDEEETVIQEVTLADGTPFSTEGNMVTRDLLFDSNTNKQFITVETRDGSVFYLIVDYDSATDEDGEQYQTYFLNAVDDEDLAALLGETTEDASEETPVCTCTEKCAVGSIDTTCEVCRTNMAECAGVEPTPEPVVEDVSEEEEQAEEEETSKGGAAKAILAVVLILGIGAAAAVYFLKNRKTAPKTRGDDDLDEYDYGQDFDGDTPDDSPPDGA